MHNYAHRYIIFPEFSGKTIQLNNDFINYKRIKTNTMDKNKSMVAF